MYLKWLINELEFFALAELVLADEKGGVEAVEGQWEKKQVAFDELGTRLEVLVGVVLGSLVFEDRWGRLWCGSRVTLIRLLFLMG